MASIEGVLRGSWGGAAYEVHFSTTSLQGAATYCVGLVGAHMPPRAGWKAEAWGIGIKWHTMSKTTARG